MFGIVGADDVTRRIVRIFTASGDGAPGFGTVSGLIGMAAVIGFDLVGSIVEAEHVDDAPDTIVPALVHEKLGTVYAQADIKADLGDARLTGNIGVQAVHTDQHTNGYVAQNGILTPVTDGAKYWDVMRR